MMNGREKSDPATVAKKSANEAERPGEEWMEPRAGAKGNADRQSTLRTQDRAGVSQALGRIRKAARKSKTEKFTALLHHVDVRLLRELYLSLRRDASPGADGVTWEDHGLDLESRLTDLHERVHRGAYRAQPSRRVMIPKGDGKQRPLAIAALEDKIVQKATLAVLNSIYEEDFLGFSYGFRPGRNQHDALDALVVGISGRKVNFILDADIRSFFDSVDQRWLIRFLEHRIGDKRILRLIQKWLKVGVLEDGIVAVSETGTGQGAVISPLLANIYLHYVFDLWAEQWRRREAQGDMIIVRYADDVVLGFEHEADARRFLEAMNERLGRVSLTLHPDKTRLIAFGRFAAARRDERVLVNRRPSTSWASPSSPARHRQGKFLVNRKSRRDRVKAKLRGDQRARCADDAPPHPRAGPMAWAGRHRLLRLPRRADQRRPVVAFHHHVTDLWRRTLRRRGQKDRMTWLDMTKLVSSMAPQTTHPPPLA